MATPTPKFPSLLPPLLLLLLTLPSMAFAASLDTTSKSFQQCLESSSSSSTIYTSDDPFFTKVLQAYIRNSRLNTSSTVKPTLIVTPLRESHISAAVQCAKKTGIHLVPRSGGHDYEGLSYVSDEKPFAILDMFQMRSIFVDVATESAWVQAGATLGEVYYAIWNATKSNPVQYGYPGGVCPTVGVGGHISGGGYGNMLRKYGLTVDNILDAVLVNAEGAVLNKAAMGEDLFWAISGGGGGSFGVVVSYRIKLVPVPKTVTIFRIEKTIDQNATAIFYDYQMIANKIDPDLFIRVLIQPITVKKTKTIRVTFIAMFLGDPKSLLKLTNSQFPSLGATEADCKPMSWIQSVLYWANFDPNASPELLQSRVSSVNFLKRKSDYLQKPISKVDLERIWKKMIELGKTGLVFNPYGGKMDEIAPGATPMPHRKGNIAKIQYSVNWAAKDGGESATNGFLQQAKDLYEFTKPWMSKNPRSAYLNYRDLDIGVNVMGKASVEQGRVYGEKYFGGNYERLVKVKSMVDPHNVFRNEQSIPATPVAAGKGSRRRRLR